MTKYLNEFVNLVLLAVYVYIACIVIRDYVPTDWQIPAAFLGGILGTGIKYSFKFNFKGKEYKLTNK